MAVNRHTHSFHKCRLCSHASVGLAQAPIILCFWKATTLTNFRSNPLFGLQKTPPSPAVCKGPTSLTVIESHRRPNNCGCCCAPWLVAIDVATSHAIAEFARLYWCDERTRVNACANKPLFHPLECSSPVVLVRHQQQWSTTEQPGVVPSFWKCMETHTLGRVCMQYRHVNAVQ